MRVGALQRLVRAALGTQLLAWHRRDELACGLGEPRLEQPLRALGALQLRRRVHRRLARLVGVRVTVHGAGSEGSHY